MSELTGKSDARPAGPAQRLFLPLWTQHQRRVFAYIYTLIPNRADAEDILQETSITLWEKFDEFEPGTDFVAWACQVAYWKIRNARRKYARSPVIHDDQLLEMMSDDAIRARPEMDRRHEALGACLKLLSSNDYNLLMSRYESGVSVKETAERTGRSLDAAYKAISRIRRVLLDCVTLRMERAGS